MTMTEDQYDYFQEEIYALQDRVKELEDRLGMNQ
jgi:hypothetical protein